MLETSFQWLTCFVDLVYISNIIFLDLYMIKILLAIHSFSAIIFRVLLLIFVFPIQVTCKYLTNEFNSYSNNLPLS